MIRKIKVSRFSNSANKEVLPTGALRQFTIVKHLETNQIGMVLGFPKEALDYRLVWFANKELQETPSIHLKPLLIKKEKEETKLLKCPFCGELKAALATNGFCHPCNASLKQHKEWKQGVCIVEGRDVVGEIVYSKFDTRKQIPLEVLGWNQGDTSKIKTSFPKDSILLKFPNGEVVKVSRYRLIDRQIKKARIQRMVKE